MKKLIIIMAAALCGSALAGPIVDLNEQLSEPQRALLNAALIEQRTSLVAAHETALAAATTGLAAQLKEAAAATAAATTAKASAEELLAANVTRQAELVTTAKAALTGTGSATEKLVALAAVLTDAAKSVADREREKLEAEAAALEKQLLEKRAAVEKLE